jgi:hypothetical protein
MPSSYFGDCCVQDVDLCVSESSLTLHLSFHRPERSSSEQTRRAVGGGLKYPHVDPILGARTAEPSPNGLSLPNYPSNSPSTIPLIAPSMEAVQAGGPAKNMADYEPPAYIVHKPFRDGSGRIEEVRSVDTKARAAMPMHTNPVFQKPSMLLRGFDDDDVEMKDSFSDLIKDREVEMQDSLIEMSDSSIDLTKE